MSTWRITARGQSLIVKDERLIPEEGRSIYALALALVDNMPDGAMGGVVETDAGEGLARWLGKRLEGEVSMITAAHLPVPDVT